MSEEETQGGSPEDARKAQIRAARLEQLARGRQTRMNNKRDRILREAAAPRTAEDVRSAPEPQMAERATTAREPTSGQEVVTRRKRDERQTSTFDLPARYKKQGRDYEYKTIRVLAQPVDAGEIQDHREAGWRPEQARDWPTLCEPGTPPDAPIERGGMRLYGRPISLTQEAKSEDYHAATSQQRDRMLAAAHGQSAVRGHDGMGGTRGVRSVPVEIQIEGIGGSGTGRGS